jgi:hypothetical protein
VKKPASRMALTKLDPMSRSITGFVSGCFFCVRAKIVTESNV